MSPTLKNLIKVTSVTLMFFAIGCSNSYLTSTPQVDETTLMSDYSTVSTGAAGFLGSSAAELDQNNSTEIFFVTSDSNRPIESVFSIGDMSFMGSQYQGMAIEDVVAQDGIQDAQVFFLDGYVTDGSQNDPRTFVLELSLNDASGNPVTYYGAQSGDGSYTFTNTDFTVTMTSSDGSQITLYTTDISTKYSQELNGTVTFDVYDQNQNYVGQITGMHLYQ